MRFLIEQTGRQGSPVVHALIDALRLDSKARDLDYVLLSYILSKLNTSLRNIPMQAARDEYRRHI